MCAAFLTLLFSVNMQAQMTIGGKKPPESFSVLELLNKGGLRLSQMSTEERDAFEVQNNVKGNGLTIYNKTTGCVEYWNEIRWVSLCDDTPQKGDNLGNHIANQTLQMGANTINFDKVDGIKTQFLNSPNGARIEHVIPWLLKTVTGSKGDSAGQFLWSNYSGAGSTEAELMRLNAAGNLGIGSNAPVSKLHVAGDMTLNKDLKVGGNAVIAGNPGTDGQVLISKGVNTAPSWVNASTLSITGDNLGNHTAGQNLNMNRNDIVFLDRYMANTYTFNLYKSNGILGIFNSLYSTNALSIEEETNKTVVSSLRIGKGTDDSLPTAGSVATAADDNGNIIWKTPLTIDAQTPKLVGLAKAAVTRPTGNNVFFDQNLVNPENAFSGDLTNGTTYTIQNNGLHQIFVNLTAGTITGAAEWYLRIKKDGVVIAALDVPKGSAALFAIDDFQKGNIISVDMGGNAAGFQADLTKISIFRFE